MATEIEDIKIKLFGKVKKKTPTSQNILDKEKLFAEFQDMEAKGRFFCTNCGTLLEITSHAVRTLSHLTETNGLSIASRYFQVTKCVCCADDFDGVIPINKI